MSISKSSGPKEAAAPNRGSLIASAIAAFVLVSVGFLGLNVLISERPQFVGTRLGAPELVLIQPAPSLLLRDESSDVNLYESRHPTRGEVRVHLNSISDYRGLKTMHSLNGHFEGIYSIENNEEENTYFLFRCRHPFFESHGRPPLSSVRLDGGPHTEIIQASSDWYWSGELAPGQTTSLKIEYEMPGRLCEFRYDMDRDAECSVPSFRLMIETEGEGEMEFSDSKGSSPPSNGPKNSMVWEREDFFPPEVYSARVAESRSLHAALTQLLQIGPLLMALFLLTLISILSARGDVTPLHVMTLSAAYAIFFPLILYLSVKFEFSTALLLSLGISGALLLNYGRLILGFRAGVLGGVAVLLVFQVFPTVTAFLGWNRGMVLLCLGVVCLFVLIDLQNRTVKRAGLLSIAFLVPGLMGSTINAQDSASIPPWVYRLFDPEKKPDELRGPALSIDLARYQVTLEDTFVNVHVTIPVIVERKSDAFHPLFDEPVYLTSRELPGIARLGMKDGLLVLYPIEAGEGEVTLQYRSPLFVVGDRTTSRIPLCLAPSGPLEILAERDDLEFENAVIWSTSALDDRTLYELSPSPASSFQLGWQEGNDESAPPPIETEPAHDVYGIGITASQQLTVINSDGSCVHLASYELPPFHPETFELVIPEGARVVSASIDQLEIDEPRVNGSTCQIPLTPGILKKGPRKLLLRLSLSRTKLGFLGDISLPLPKAMRTIGELNWVIVFPEAFQVQLRSSDMNLVDQTPDLSFFGAYKSILGERASIHLRKCLAPSRDVSVLIQYCQDVGQTTKELLKHLRFSEGASGTR